MVKQIKETRGLHKEKNQLLAVLLSALLVLLSGCSNVVSQQDIRDAEKFCAGKEGVYQIRLNGNYGRTWECKNGDKKDIIKPS